MCVCPAVPFETAGGPSGHERTACQSLRAAGRYCQGTWTHQPHTGDRQQVLTAKDREVRRTRFPFPQILHPPSSFLSFLNIFPFLLDQLNRDHWDFAEPGGVSLRAGGAASLHGAAPSQEGEEGTTQDHPLLPLPEGALHSTQVWHSTVLTTACRADNT